MSRLLSFAAGLVGAELFFVLAGSIQRSDGEIAFAAAVFMLLIVMAISDWRNQ